MFRGVIIAFWALVFAFPAQPQVIECTAMVIDGDTIDMTGMRIRLAYIDAPEAVQTCDKDNEPWACGDFATAELASIIEGQSVSCTVIDRDVYRRQVATCRTRVFDVGHEMVRRGVAIALDTAPFEYNEATEVAQRLNSGLWASTFELPWVWRAENPQLVPEVASREPLPTVRAQPVREPSYQNQNGCLIKGNRNRRGEWIYHLPGRPYYDQTRAEEMFCTEREARAAGYRRSRA